MMYFYIWETCFSRNIPYLKSYLSLSLETELEIARLAKCCTSILRALFKFSRHFIRYLLVSCFHRSVFLQHNSCECGEEPESERRDKFREVFVRMYFSRSTLSGWPFVTSLDLHRTQTEERNPNHPVDASHQQRVRSQMEAPNFLRFQFPLLVYRFWWNAKFPPLQVI